MLVKNNSSRAIPLGRYMLSPGEVTDKIPDPILYLPRVQDLRKAGDLIFPFREEKKEKVVKTLELVDEVKSPETAVSFVAEPPDEAESPAADDLLDLVHIGIVREGNLHSRGITTFAQVVNLGAPRLASVLSISMDEAEEIIEDAEARL